MGLGKRFYLGERVSSGNNSFSVYITWLETIQEKRDKRKIPGFSKL